MKILIGGSPCTHWSIAQTKNRETEASGIGWELFLNYRIARDKYQPDGSARPVGGNGDHAVGAAAT